MNIILGNIAIWQPKLNDQLTVRPTPPGASYQKTGTNILEIANKPLYRYAKNYKTAGENGVKYCLFVRTFSTDKDAVERELDAFAETLQAEDVRPAVAGSDSVHFTYSNHYLETE